MPNYVTKEHFDARLNDFRDEFDKKFVTKEEFHGRMDDMMTKMDGMAVILQRLDQERLFTVEWIRRIESDVSMVKKHLKLVS